MLVRLLRIALVLIPLCLIAWAARGLALAAGMNTVQGYVTTADNHLLSDVVVVLQDDAGSTTALTTTDASGQYRFQDLDTSTYRVVAIDLPGAAAGDAFPGPHAVKLDSTTIQVTMVPGVTQYFSNDFVKNLPQQPTFRIDPLLMLGGLIPLNGQLGFSNLNPLELDPGSSAIRRIADDGSLFVLDPAGTALLRFPPLPGNLQIALDTTAQDPMDKVALTRLLRVETNRSGVSAILALRADNTRGIYRLDDQRRLTRLDLLPGAAGPSELAIDDSGQIAYITNIDRRNPSSPFALYQASGAGPPVELLRQGQPAANGATVAAFGYLTGNGGGDLSILEALRSTNGTITWAVLRKRGSAPLAIAAMTGGLVQRERGSGFLGQLGRPLIGADGTVVFPAYAFVVFTDTGATGTYLNFFVARPDGSVQPLLDWALWNSSSFDYDVAADGAVALRVSLLPSSQSRLYLVAPTGDLSLIAGAQANVPPLPVGRPVFGPGGVLFFQAQDPDWPPDRNARIPVGLFRYRPGDANPAAVAVPEQPVPGRPGQVLLGVPQPPVVSAGTVAFAGLFGGTERFPVPTTGLFRVPLNGTLADGALVGAQGGALSAAATVIAFRDFYYTADGTLIFDTFARQGLAVGQLVATLAPRASTAGALRSQAAMTDAPAPLLIAGADLGAGRSLQRQLGQLTSLGAGRWLFTAQFSQPGGAGEGLFTIDASKQVQALAVTDGPAAGPSLAAARFIGFGEIPPGGDPAAYAAFPLSIGADGSVVFKARLEKGGVPAAGLFQWTGADSTAIAASDPDQDTLALSAEDQPPYDLTRWAAGVKGHAYFLERHHTRSGAAVSRLFDSSAAGLQPLVDAGVPPGVRGSASSLTDLSDMVGNHFGTVLINGATAGGPAILSIGPAGLMPLASKDQPIPPEADGTKHPDLFFDGNFVLYPTQGPSGDLGFGADLRKSGEQGTSHYGVFRRNLQGALETVFTGSFSGGHNSISTLPVIASATDRHPGRPLVTLALSQSQPGVDGPIAFAAQSSDGRWAIYRSGSVRDPRTGNTSNSIVLIAKEAPGMVGGTHFVSLDPSILLGRPAGSGPVFRLNAAGDVVFLGSDGQRWGIYRFSDTEP